MKTMRDELVEQVAATVRPHHTGSDGVWVQCYCAGKPWMGLDQWSSHVAHHVVDKLLKSAKQWRENKDAPAVP